MNDKSDEELTARLMRIAGQRADIPADTEARIYERVLDEWLDENQAAAGKNVYKSVERSWMWGLTRKRLMQWIAPILVTASVAFIAIDLSETEPVAVPAVGSVARLVGFEADDSLASGQQLLPGVTLSTGDDQGISILLARNESLRLDENTRLHVDDKNQFTLLEGRIYADTGQFMYRNGGLSIVAGAATVTDVGTQFSVAFDGSLLDVGVREGRVDIGSVAADAVAIAGERVQIDDSGVVLSEELRPDDDYWLWASNLAPVYNMNKKSLMDFLHWAARETGLQLVFENDELRMAAMRTDLHGTISDLRPSEAIDVVMATTSFNYRIEAGTIYIDR